MFNMIVSFLKTILIFCIRKPVLISFIFISFFVHKLWGVSKKILVLNAMIMIIERMAWLLAEKYFKKNRSPLKLLELPVLVQHEVMKRMTPRDLMMLGKCSTKTKNSYKAWRSKSIKLTVSLGQDAGGKMYTVALNEGNHPCLTFKDTMEGIKDWTEYILDLFDSQLHTIIIDTFGLSKSNMRKALEWLSKFRKTAKNIRLTGDLDEKNTRSFVRNIVWKNKMVNVHFDDSQWIGLRDLYSIKAKMINLQKSEITDEEVNFLLKHWIDGNLPCLQHLFIARKKGADMYDEEKMFSDIDVSLAFTETKSMRVPAMKETLVLPSLCMASGYQIRRKDGVTGIFAKGCTDNSFPAILLIVEPEFVDDNENII